MSYTAMFRARAAEEHLELLRRALAKLASDSLREPATLRYEFYQLRDDPVEFVLIGEWKSEDDWRAHVAGPTHTAYSASLPEGAWEQSPVQTRLVPLE